jgi:hypothetical protein
MQVVTCTYVRCNIYRSRTCWYLLVQDEFWHMMNFGTLLITGYWYRLVTVCWHILLQVYSGISHNDSVAVVSPFHLYFMVVGQSKDRWL